jgi:fatty acid-binding protein DegV
MWNLVCDSSCDMKSAVLEPDRLKLEVVPMRIQVGGQDYTDDETLSVPSSAGGHASGEKRLLHRLPRAGGLCQGL